MKLCRNNRQISVQFQTSDQSSNFNTEVVIFVAKVFSSFKDLLYADI